MMRRLAFQVLAVSAFSVGASNAEEPVSKSPDVLMRGDRLEQTARHIVKVSGNTEAKGPGFHLRSDRLEVRQDPAAASDSLPILIIADGNVVLSRGQERLTLDRLEFNPQTGIGTFTFPRRN